MKRKDPLAQLIQSLSANEKRYFKLFCGTGANQKNYMRIFNAIDKKPDSRNDDLKKIVIGKSVNISYEKSYLYKILLKALRNFFEEEGIDNILYTALQEIRILCNKGMFDACRTLIESTLKLAEEHNCYAIQLELFYWKRRIFLRQSSYAQLKDLNKELQQVELSTLRKIENIYGYKNIQTELLHFYTLKGSMYNHEEIAELNKIINVPLMQSKDLALTDSAKHIYFESKSSYYAAIQQPEKALQYAIELVNFLETKPRKIQMEPQPYFASLTSLVNRYSLLYRYNEALQVVEKMKAVPKIKNVRISKNFQSIINTYCTERAIILYTYSEQFEKAIQFYEQNKAEVNQDQYATQPKFQITFNTMGAIAYFSTAQYDKALTPLRIILEKTESQQRNDLIITAHILHIIVQYELGSHELIPYLIKSTKYLAKTRKLKMSALELLFSFFTQLAKNPSPKILKSLITEYQPKFAEAMKQPDGKTLLDTIELERWLKTKLK